MNNIKAKILLSNGSWRRDCTELELSRVVIE